MGHGIKPSENLNTQTDYADIIDLPPWEPGSRHPRMSLHDRAAQFAPFAALAGYEEMVDDEIRITDPQIELAEGRADLLNRQLNRMSEIIAGGGRPEVSVTYFIPDPRKAGGKYATASARVRRIDSAAGKVILLAGDDPDVPETIAFDRILSIQGEAVDGLDY